MMSDTYQRIQAQSDVEWKFGRAKLVREMHRTVATPSPLNLFTSWLIYFVQLSRRHVVREDDHDARLVNVTTATAKKEWWKTFQHQTKVNPRDSNPLGAVRHPLSSQMSIAGDRRNLENVIDWRLVVKQYLGTANVSK